MLKALIAGTGTPEALADLAQRRMRRKRAALGEALTGRVTAHHRFMLERLLCHIEFLDEAIATSDRHIERLTTPQVLIPTKPITRSERRRSLDPIEAEHHVQPMASGPSRSEATLVSG